MSIKITGFIHESAFLFIVKYDFGCFFCSLSFGFGAVERAVWKIFMRMAASSTGENVHNKKISNNRKKKNYSIVSFCVLVVAAELGSARLSTHFLFGFEIRIAPHHSQ